MRGKHMTDHDDSSASDTTDTGWGTFSNEECLQLHRALARMPYGAGLAITAPTNIPELVDYLRHLADRLGRHAVVCEANDRELSVLRVQRAAVREFLGTNGSEKR